MVENGNPVTNAITTANDAFRKLTSSKIYLMLSSVVVSTLVLYVVQTVIMAGPYDCSAYDKETNQVSGCDKFYGSERSATGKTWNISALEKCVIEGLKEEFPSWHSCQQDKTAVENLFKDYDYDKNFIIDCLPDQKPGEEHFWSSKNLSHFNFYDFHSAPAFMLSTNERKGQNHLGYVKHTVGGTKNIYAEGHREAMYERAPIDITSIALVGFAVVLVIMVSVVSIMERGKSDLVQATLLAVITIFVTLSLFSHLYGYTHAENFLSPFPTSPREALRDPVNGTYDLIPFRNLTFKPSKDCLRGVGQAINEDPGSLWHHSTGVHGGTLKGAITFAVVLYLFPLSLFALFSTDGEDSKKERGVHIVAFAVIIVLAGMIIDLSSNHMRDDRCGTDGWSLSTLGASPGTHRQSTGMRDFGLVTACVLLGIAAIGLLMELFVVYEIMGEGNTNQSAFKAAFSSFVLPLLIILQAIYIGDLVGKNASDLCEAPYDDAGAYRISVIFFVTMVTYVVYALSRIQQAYQGTASTGMGMTRMKMANKMGTKNSSNLETTFI